LILLEEKTFKFGFAVTYLGGKNESAGGQRYHDQYRKKVLESEVDDYRVGPH